MGAGAAVPRAPPLTGYPIAGGTRSDLPLPMTDDIDEPGTELRGLAPFFGRPDAFHARFATEQACRNFLFQQRWRQGFSCPECGNGSFRWLDSKRLLCLRCRKKTSLTAGTILERTRKPLSLWFRAAYLVAQPGMNASKLARLCKLTYKVAWTWAQKLRRVMRLKTALDAPIPPFDRTSWDLRRMATPPRVLRQWFVRHGCFQWNADREGGLGTCCERLDSADWRDPEPEDKDRYAAYNCGMSLSFGKPFLKEAYSGSVSDKHLRAYFDETELRVNVRAMSAEDRAMMLVGRFMATPPCTYRMITGPRKPRAPLWISAPRLETIPLVG